MKYFQQFPTITYTMTESGESQSVVMPRVVPNMTVYLSLDISDETGGIPYENYRIRDDDRPDTVAARLYGEARYAWVLLLANKMRDWYDWPLTDLEFHDYVNRKYESSVGARDGALRCADTDLMVPQYIWVKTDGQELMVDKTFYDELPASEQKIVTVYEREYQENDARRMIRVPTMGALDAVVSQLNRVLARS